MASKLGYIYKVYLEIETAIVNNLLRRFLPGEFVPALINLPKVEDTKEKFSLNEVMQESFLWAVPKKRRSAEKVKNRKFGVPKYVWKPIVSKKNLVTCNKCGGHHEWDTLCGTCYNEVMSETKFMQDEIMKSIGISPVEEDVVVLYKGEKEKDPKLWKGKRIVELKKERPTFFSKNLLQGSTQPKSKTSELMEIIQPIEYK